MNTAIVQTGNAIRVLNIGFLGIGWIGKNRMDALVGSGIVAPYAIADSILERASEAASWNGARVCAGLDDILKCDLDGLVIATPSALHASQVKEALNHGFAVFCQKPLARTADEVNEIIECARLNDRLLGVDLSYRHLRGIRLIKEMVESGELGEIFAAQLFFHNAYGPDKPWFYDPSLSGGGCVIDLGIHLTDLILWLTGFPAVKNVVGRLFASGKRIRGRSSSVVEDFAVAQFDLESGCNVHLACSWKLNAGMDAVIGMTLYGTKGAVRLLNVNGSFYDFKVEHLKGTSSSVICEPPDNWGGRAAIDWASSLYESNRFNPEIVHAADVASVLDAIYVNS